MKPGKSKSCLIHKMQTGNLCPLAKGSNIEAWYLSRALGGMKKKINLRKLIPRFGLYRCMCPNLYYLSGVGCPS